MAAPDAAAGVEFALCQSLIRSQSDDEERHGRSMHRGNIQDLPLAHH